MKEDNLDRPFIEKFSDILGGLILLVTAYYTLTSWSGLPDRIATHFDINGNPDGYGDKWTLLLLLGMMVFLYLLFRFIDRFPKAFNYAVKITEENRQRQQKLATTFLHIIGLEIIAMLAFIQWGIIQGAVTNSYRLNPTIMIGLVAIILISTVIYFCRSIKAR